MPNPHQFKLSLNWELKEKPANRSVRYYKKSHQISISGKELLNVSAAKIFKGDPLLFNPEDLLLASITSCHMMSYLYCCDMNQIEVISYTDHSEASLKVNEDGSGKIEKVILKPVVVINDKSKLELANYLHTEANKLCFIANSCNFEIEHYPISS